MSINIYSGLNQILSLCLPTFINPMDSQTVSDWKEIRLRRRCMLQHHLTLSTLSKPK